MGTRTEAIKNKVIIDTNFYEYWNQCRMLNYAAQENYHLFLESTNQPFSVENELKQMGYFNAALLLRAVAIENLIKSRVLFQMKEEGDLPKDISLKEIIEKYWTRKISHNPLKLCKKYNIDLNIEETALIQNHLDHMDWAGRFPFPVKISNVKSEQVLGGDQSIEMNKLIFRFANEMNLDLNAL